METSIESLVGEMKKQLFSSSPGDELLLVAPSAYDTAWLAMIPHPSNPDRPLFQSCLDWVLASQNEEGLWGWDSHNDDISAALYALPATLACLVALKKWNVGQHNICKGLGLFNANVDMVLTTTVKDWRLLPCWFAIVFPGMIELAQSIGLHLNLVNKNNHETNTLLSTLFHKRNQILHREKVVDEWGHCSPLLAYMECFPADTISGDEQDRINEVLREGDGSIFRSPSATAFQFMASANTNSLKYLNSVAQHYPHGVPARYPVDQHLVKLCMLDHIQRLGLDEHFSQEIEQSLSQIYRQEEEEEEWGVPSHEMMTRLGEKLHKDSLSFRLLRLHGYHVNPRRVSWFLEHKEIRVQLEEKWEYFSSALYNIYRATDVVFPGENELETARSFSLKLLQNSHLPNPDNLPLFPEWQKLIDHEVSVPWIGRMDHLDNRLWIENKLNPLMWIGKASYYRFSPHQNKKLLQLAMQNFEFRQSTYRNELEDLKRWSNEKGLVDIGFGREKTIYLYFAIATSTCLPHDSIIRLIVSKAAILITVADDFYDMEGSLSDLQLLTSAIQRWDGDHLCGPSKIIFNALEDVVNDIATRYYVLHGIEITAQLRNLWRETFESWMMESIWSRTGYKPSMEQYLKTANTSIGIDTMLLPAAWFLTPTLPLQNLNHAHYGDPTKLLMTTSRLLNDTHSYQKEIKDGKMNYVLLHMNENPGGNIEDSVAHVKDIVAKKRKEFLKHVLMEDDDMPKPCKLLHLSFLKVFQMFFNSYNLFDSKTDLIHEIKKAFYIPFEHA